MATDFVASFDGENYELYCEAFDEEFEEMIEFNNGQFFWRKD